MITLNAVFTTGLIIFSVVSLWFLISKRSSRFNSAFLVAGVTALSYALMLDGALAFQLGGGEVAHWTRWAGYALSCSLLMWVISAGMQSKKVRLTAVGITPLIMLAGSMAAVTAGWVSWLMFALSTLWYVYLLYLLFVKGDPKSMDRWKKYIWLGWTMFPVVFLLSPVYLAVLTSAAAAGLYLLLDVFTKIIFYLEKHSVAQANE